jgi:hypothetical protein
LDRLTGFRRRMGILERRFFWSGRNDMDGMDESRLEVGLGRGEGGHAPKVSCHEKRRVARVRP